MKQIFQFVLLGLAFLLFLTLYHSYRFTDNNFHVIFCNVGQGDGILLRTPRGIDIVIDGGPNENSMTQCLSRHLPFWDRDIEAVFMTHPDADHLTGLISVAKSYNIKYFGTVKAQKGTEVYQEMMKILDSKNIRVDYVFKGDRVETKDGLLMEALWPTQQFLNNPSEDTNDFSLVQYIKFGKFTALLTGDIPAVYLNSIMPTVRSVDVFKPPHHGSKTGVDEFTFQHVIPKFAVISAGMRNRYGHPNKEVLNLLKATNIPYKTTVDGDIEIVTDGKEWETKGN